MKINRIETERLFLRGFEKDDAPFAISIWNDPEMGEYLSDPTEENMSDEYRKFIETLGDDENCCYLIAEFKKDAKRIGTCSFIPNEDGKVFDIAYCVHKNYWNNGYATEMVQGMIEYAKNKGAKKITVAVDKENGASNAVMRKLGFHVGSEGSYKKSGTELVFADYKYELCI
ncbi:GNAT family N-acetyltransferase [Anaeromicropila herbilytica]|uniref:N-acetyltransferase n=1 Tax=Anaeromicropila herbilytica TaxID=2785025 RepID=A0A7R7ELL8_9FIRM|nr:GNAT family N-acetyltransferase [Anaeromicropila herbilytica]BCN30830.1 N-acetyltransferase [Anaeromicropila herbilytica]